MVGQRHPLSDDLTARRNTVVACQCTICADSGHREARDSVGPLFSELVSQATGRGLRNTAPTAEDTWPRSIR